MFPFAQRPDWAKVSLNPEERAALHESWVEIVNTIHACESWEARIQPAIDRLK